jgi:copper chaperone NosL
MKPESIVLKSVSRVLLVLAALLLIVSLFVPIWRIELDAPQYPEGLMLTIHANKLGGNVDIINGLNHYIGMKTLHAEDFIEFTLLPYLISFFAAFGILTAILKRKRIFYSLFICFVLFGIIAMVDFWRWEYNYGHNLDPNAAIIVPGMAYQPPLIGFKQLLNFGAFSVPDIGGWLFVASGAIMLVVLLIEKNLLMKKRFVALNAALVVTFFASSCQQVGPEPAHLNKDNCEYCKMTISDPKFVTELVTEKGRIYKFDDAACLKNYINEHALAKNDRLYAIDFDHPNEFVKIEDAVFVQGESITSPMGGNVAAFSKKASAENFAKDKTVQILSWNDLQE